MEDYTLGQLSAFFISLAQIVTVPRAKGERGVGFVTGDTFVDQR